MAFNPSISDGDRGDLMAQIFSKIISCISKEPELRSAAEIDYLIPWIQKRSEIFKNITKAVMIDVIRNCEYQKTSFDEVIIKQGDIGDSFYIILIGSVAVYIDAQLSGEEEVENNDALNHPPGRRSSKNSNSKEKHEKKVNENKDPGENSKSIKNEKEINDDKLDGENNNNKSEKEISESNKSDTKKKKPIDRDIYGKFIIQFEAGKSFGELALISESSSVRNATIISDEECHLLVIKRELYNRTLKAFQQQEYAQRHDFVNRNPLFSKWSPKFKSLLEMSLRKEHYSFDSQIVKQGDPVTGLIFIRKGQARLICDPVKHQQQFDNILHVESEVDQLLDSVKNKKKQNLLYDTLTKQPTKQRSLRLRRNEGYAAAEKENLSRNVVICTVSQREVIGDIEISMRLPNYIHSVVCSEETEVYILDMKNFDRLITKKNPQTVDAIKFGVVSKLRSRSETKHGQIVPLLGHLLFQLTRPVVKRTEDKPSYSLEKLPEIKTQKSLPDEDTLNLLLIDRFMKNRGVISQSHVPGTPYYKTLMEEKTKKREEQRQRYIERKQKHENRYAQQSQGMPQRQVEVQNSVVNHSKKSNKESSPVREVVSTKPEKIDPPKQEVTKEEILPHKQEIISGTITKNIMLETINEDTEEKEQVFVTELPPKEKSELTNTKEEEKQPRGVTFCEEEEIVADEPNERVPYEFVDEETNDSTLSYLEERLKDFLVRQGSKSGRPTKVRQLKRYSNDDDENIRFPKPGGRVMIKKRVCRFADSKFLVKTHSHIKYHMIKDSHDTLTNFMLAKAMQKRQSMVKT